MEGKGADQVSCSPSHQLIKSIPTSSTKTATRKQTIPYAHYSFLTHRSTLCQPNFPLNTTNTLPGFGKFGRGRTRTMEGNKMSSLVERQSLHTKSRPTVSIWGAIRDQLCFLGLQDPGHVEIACNKLAFPSDIKKNRNLLRASLVGDIFRPSLESVSLKFSSSSLFSRQQEH